MIYSPFISYSSYSSFRENTTSLCLFSSRIFLPSILSSKSIFLCSNSSFFALRAWILLSIYPSAEVKYDILSDICLISPRTRSNYSGLNRRFFCLLRSSLNIRSGLAFILYNFFAALELLLLWIFNFSLSWFDSICRPIISLKIAFSLLNKMGPVCSWLLTYISIYLPI